jgi:CRP-like cAMP-binding protein
LVIGLDITPNVTKEELKTKALKMICQNTTTDTIDSNLNQAELGKCIEKRPPEFYDEVGEMGFACEPYDPARGVRVEHVIHPKGSSTRKFIEGVIKFTNFGHFDQEKLRRVVDIMYERKVEAGETVFVQGDPANQFYIIETGKFQISADGKMYQILGPKLSFNEHALVRIANQSYTVTALESGILWTMDRITFNRTLADLEYNIIMSGLSSLCSIPQFSMLTGDVLLSLAKIMERREFSKGQFIAVGEYDDNELYIIESGGANLTVCRENIKKLSAGDYFMGPGSIRRHHPIESIVVADSEVKCLKLSGSRFGLIMGKALKEFCKTNEEGMLI